MSRLVVSSKEVALTLNQALATLRRQDGMVSRREVFLACGFQPLHLLTFLKAHLAMRFPDRATDILVGRYGDLEGALAGAAQSNATGAAVAIEWADLDPRLGLRGAGGWGLSVQRDILANCLDRWARTLEKLRDVASRMPVALAAPTLPIPLAGHTAGWQMSLTEVDLHKQAAAFLADAARIGNVAILHPSRLARLSPEASRLDPNMELAAGFPYSLGHASVLAGQLTQLLYPPSPMKGLITDLDETLWSGIVGEIGAAAVSWSLGEHSQVHGLYQQELRHLSEMGVLLAIASKNDMAVVEEALRREDLYVPGSAFFPVKADWGPKSLAAAEILRAWNVGPESVVLVDDSPMELEEVRAAFPSMTCLPFPRRSPAKALELFEQLRDLFGKPAVQLEDTLRQSSIRANARIQEAAAQSPGGDFVRGLEGRLVFDARKDSANKRLLELIDKTNQFNLNGVRITEGEWLRHLQDGSGFAVGVSYEDRFGPLGVIGAMAGRQKAGLVEVTSWVLSCRAFSRRIERHMLDYLFHRPGATTIRLSFRPTERNGPMREFLRSLGLDCDSPGGVELPVERASGLQEELPHEVRTLDEE
jgi:FkbH-like protein